MEYHFQKFDCQYYNIQHNKIDYYCFSFRDFNEEKLIKYEFIPDLCKKFKVEKNLINPIYSG